MTKERVTKHIVLTKTTYDDLMRHGIEGEKPDTILKRILAKLEELQITCR